MVAMAFNEIQKYILILILTYSSQGHEACQIKADAKHPRQCLGHNRYSANIGPLSP